MNQKKSKSTGFNLIPSFSIRRPVTVIMFFLSLCLWGIISFFRIPVELLPNTSFNNVSVMTSIRGGMAPAEVEQLVTIPIEDSMATVSGLKRIASTSKEGRAVVVLSFPAGFDMDLASLEISEKYERIKNDLPREVERPVIAKYEQNDLPIVHIALYSLKLTTEDLRVIVDRSIKSAIIRAHGVANVEVSGGREQKIVIDVDEQKMISRGIKISDMTTIIGGSNLNLLTGEVKGNDKKTILRSEGIYSNLDEVKKTIIRANGINDIVRVDDIATVAYQYMDQKTVSRINGRSVVSLYIQKESDANTIATSDAIKEAIADLKKTILSDIEVETISDQAIFIKEAISNVQKALFIGAILAILVLFGFLRNFTPTIIIGISIPLSVIICVGCMYLTNVTINIMSLSGLALGIGMLVDNAIVVLENIAKWMEKGKDKHEAAVCGTSEIFLAILASTISTLIVFLPIVFVNPQIKMMYGGLSLTVVFSLTASLLISVTLIPSLFAHSKGAFEQKTSSFFNKVTAAYEECLSLIIIYRYWVVGIIVVLFTLSLVYLNVIDKDISGKTDDNKFTIFVELQSGAKLNKSNNIVSAVEGIVKNIPEIEQYSVRIEGWSSKVYVTVKQEEKKKIKVIVQNIREKVAHLGGKEKAFIYLSADKSTGGNEVVVNIFGQNYKKLLELSSLVFKEVRGVDGFFDFKLRYKPGRPEKIFQVNKERAALCGFSVKDVADSIHAKIRGLRATKIFKDGKEIETIIRLREDNRKTLKEAMALTLVNKFGDHIKLDGIVDFKDNLAPSEIWHQDKIRMIQVSFTTNDYALTKAVELVSSQLENIDLPPDYYFEFGNDYIEMKKTYRNLQLAVVVMLLLVYMLLASLFESYIQPFIIMISVPLALIGVSLSLALTYNKITMGVLIGIIMLGGIVVNNAIVLLDKICQLQNSGMSEIEAIISAGKNRLRPILMTSSTTILGLIPLSLDRSSASSLWSPLALTVIGGLLSATILTLFLIPVILICFNDLKLFLKQHKIFVRIKR